MEKEPNVCFRARRKWDISEIPTSCVLHIAAESRYRLYINGMRIGIGPIRGTIGVNFFDSYEIAPLLQNGQNWIAVAVQSPNIPTFKAAPAQPAVVIQLDDGAQIATDDSWEVQLAPDWRRDVPLFTFQIGHMEWQDLAREPRGWQVGKDESQWQPAAVVSKNERLAAKAMRPRDIPALREEMHLPAAVPVIAALPPLEDPNDTAVAARMTNEAHSPLKETVNPTPLSLASGKAVTLTPGPDGGGVTLILDFQREVNGGLEIDLDAPAGTILDVGYEEVLHDGRLKSAAHIYAFADRYLLREGRQTVGNRFGERGFRMTQIALRNFSRPIRIYAARGIDRVYPYVQRASFTCSDSLLNEIWTICRQTVQACSTDTVVDCPWRENAFYVNDLVVENVTSLQAFGDPRFNARCFRLAAANAREDGLIPGPSPNGLLPEKSASESADRMVLLAANLFWPGMLEEYLLYSGDADLVRELANGIVKILDTFASWEDSDGLIQPPAKHWNFVDWSYEMTGPSLDGRNTAIMNWFYVTALDTAARLFKRVGDNRDTSIWSAKAARVAAATDKRFWQESRQCYVEWLNDGQPGEVASQLCQAIALLSARAPQNRKAPLEKALGRADLLAPELYLHHFVLRALVNASKSADALAVIRRYWGPIVLSGSPTVWECGVHGQGKSAFGDVGSMCHGFATTPIDFFQGVVLGVRPTESGFERCRIAPQTLGLEHAAGSVPTPNGNLEMAWRRENGQLVVDLTLPPGTTAELPNGQTKSGGKHQLKWSE
jgi:hypothetical protein